jgi:pimeloyl-ACP methyl ester carboxylesterase
MTNVPDVQMGIAEIAGASLYYEIAGEGSCLVLAHAGIADRTMWDYRVIRYDMRGFGDSPMTPGPFSHRQDLFGLLDFLGIEQAHLIGCSNGGATVIDFALEHPEMASSLVLVASAVNGYQFSGAPPKPVLELMAALNKRNLDKAAELAAQIWVDGPQRTPDQLDLKVRERVKEMSRAALINQLPDAVSEEGLEPPATQRLPELDVPTLVVVGDLDDASILGIAEVLTGGIAGAKKMVIPGTAHMLAMEKPEAFNRVLLDFLQQV